MVCESQSGPGTDSSVQRTTFESPFLVARRALRRCGILTRPVPYTFPSMSIEILKAVSVHESMIQVL